MIWGQPQPETVSDFRIEAFGPTGRQQLLIDETANFQRLRRFPVAPGEPISRLRVTVLATNGLDHARIFEIRIS